MGKYLGQHFLTSPAIAARIVAASGVKARDVVLEIGAGKGMLTRALAFTAARIIAVEKDRALIETLAASDIAGMPNVIIREGDIRELLRKEAFRGRLGKRYHVVANIPYYLTAHLFRMLLQEMPSPPQSITLLIQKEVARRVCARAPHANLLALSVQSYGTPDIVRDVSRRHFLPQPGVDSSILRISNISKIFFSKNRISELAFFRVLRAGFAQPRKQLKNNLRGLFGARAPAALHTCGIATRSRPENIAREAWACLTRCVTPRK